MNKIRFNEFACKKVLVKKWILRWKSSALPATGERPAPDTIDTAVAIGAIGTTSAGRLASSGALRGGVNAYIYSKGASAASIIILMKSSSPTPSSTKTNIS